jgi:hypothetical protein
MEIRKVPATDAPRAQQRHHSSRESDRGSKSPTIEAQLKDHDWSPPRRRALRTRSGTEKTGSIPPIIPFEIDGMNDPIAGDDRHDHQDDGADTLGPGGTAEEQPPHQHHHAKEKAAEDGGHHVEVDDQRIDEPEQPLKRNSDDAWPQPEGLALDDG